ncbi:Uncharacterised protein [Bordetella pertussis]|nr:Uncharacterised protein [Bordetella pertussis]
MSPTRHVRGDSTPRGGGQILDHHLQVIGQLRAGLAARQRMAGRGHRPGGNRRQEATPDLVVGPLQHGNRQRAAARLERLRRPAQRSVFDPHPHAGIARVHGLERMRHRVGRKQRIDRQRQAQFDPFAQFVRMGAQGVDLGQDDAHIGQQRLAGGRQGRLVDRAVEQSDAQLRLQVGDGVADGRLHPMQPRRRESCRPAPRRRRCASGRA